MNTSKPGYEISDQDKKTINPKVLCCKCKNIVRNALQTSCGHRYCAGCLDNDFKGEGLTVCVVCGQSLTRNEVFKDKFVDREVQSLILHCIYVVFGCNWKGELRNREEHQKSCESAPVGCIYPQCDKQFPKNRLADHLRDECLYRELICSFCKQPYEAVHTKKHEEQCPSFPITCPSCNKEYPRSELDKHRDPYSFDVCEAIEVFCPFVPTGCKHKKPMKHDERTVHLKKNQDKHLSLFEAKVLQLLPYLEDLISGLSHPSKGFKNGKLVPDFQMIEDQITSVKTEVLARIQELEYRTSSLGYPSLAATSYGVGGAEVKDLVRRLDNNDAKSASQDLLLNEAHATIAQLSQELAKANQKVEKAEESVRKLEKRLAEQEELAGLRNLAIADLEEKLKDNIGCSYDGILLFKITQVARKRADAF